MNKAYIQQAIVELVTSIKVTRREIRTTKNRKDFNASHHLNYLHGCLAADQETLAYWKKKLAEA